MARITSDLTPVLHRDCSEFGLCGGLEGKKPQTVGEAVRAITARFEKAQAAGEWLDRPLWLDA